MQSEIIVKSRFYFSLQAWAFKTLSYYRSFFIFMDNHNKASDVGQVLTPCSPACFCSLTHTHTQIFLECDFTPSSEWQACVPTFTPQPELFWSVAIITSCPMVAGFLTRSISWTGMGVSSFSSQHKSGFTLTFICSHKQKTSSIICLRTLL